MKTIATINFKGGVGKTTLTWCLGDVLAHLENERVLLFDLDAQMSLTQAIAFGASKTDGASFGKFAEWQAGSMEHDLTISSVLRRHVENDLQGFEPGDGFIHRLKDNYHFVPSTEELYWLETENLDPSRGRYFIKNLLGRIGNSGSLPRYDYVLFDCPPSFTMLSYSVLTSCDLVLIPFNADFFAAKGIDALVTGLHRRIQPHPLPTLCVFANQVRTWRRPTRAAKGWMDDVRKICREAGDRVGRDVRYLDTWIPDRASLRDAIVNQETPNELADNFRALWQEAKKAL